MASGCGKKSPQKSTYVTASRIASPQLLRDRSSARRGRASCSDPSRPAGRRRVAQPAMIRAAVVDGDIAASRRDHPRAGAARRATPTVARAFRGAAAWRHSPRKSRRAASTVRPRACVLCSRVRGRRGQAVQLARHVRRRGRSAPPAARTRTPKIDAVEAAPTGAIRRGKRVCLQAARRAHRHTPPQHRFSTSGAALDDAFVARLRPARDDVARAPAHADARRRIRRNTYGKCTSFSSLYFCSLPADVTCVHS